MHNRGMAFLGLILMAVGAVLLLGTIFDFNLWSVCFPLGLILLGLFVLLRPRLVPAGTLSHVTFIGDVTRAGAWTVQDEEYWNFVGDIELDLTRADIPPGETLIRGFGFVNDVDIVLPAGVGLALDLASFVSSVKVDGQEEENFLSPVHWRSEDYKAAERRVRFDLIQFVGEVTVRQV